MDDERSEGTRWCVRNRCRGGDRCTNERENRQKSDSQSQMTGRSIEVMPQGKAREQRRDDRGTSVGRPPQHRVVPIRL